VKYNLTDQQKDLARFLVKEVRTGNLKETFYAQQKLQASGQKSAALSVGDDSISNMSILKALKVN